MYDLRLLIVSDGSEQRADLVRRLAGACAHIVVCDGVHAATHARNGHIEVAVLQVERGGEQRALELARELSSSGCASVLLDSPGCQWDADEDDRFPIIAPGEERVLRLQVENVGLRQRLVAERERVEIELSAHQALLREVHHRVNNNLQFISSLIHLSALRVASARPARELADLRSRITTMALAHDHLYRSDDLSSVELAAYFTDLIAHIQSTHATTRPNIAIRTEIENVTVDAETALPMGLLLTELLTNALTHAFPAGAENAAVDIALRRSDGDLAELIVRDNGRGIPARILEARRALLGLQLVEVLCRQLRASLELPAAGESRFRILVPIADRES